MRTSLVALALTGCTFPEKPGPPFACVDEPLPTTAPDIIHISGNVFDPDSTQAVVGATVKDLLIDSTSVRFTTETDNRGAFAHDDMTPGAPLNEFLNVHLDDTNDPWTDTDAYPATSITHDVNVTVVQFRTREIVDFGLHSGVMPFPDGNPYMLVSVVDCNDNPVVGAKITVSPQPMGVKVTYIGPMGPDLSADATGFPYGSAFITGLTSGPVTVGATFESIPFRSHTVNTNLGTLVFTEVSP